MVPFNCRQAVTISLLPKTQKLPQITTGRPVGAMHKLSVAASRPDVQLVHALVVHGMQVQWLRLPPCQMEFSEMVGPVPEW